MVTALRLIPAVLVQEWHPAAADEPQQSVISGSRQMILSGASHLQLCVLYTIHARVVKALCCVSASCTLTCSKCSCRYDAAAAGCIHVFHMHV